MIKKLILTTSILLMALWAWPAQAGCNCTYQNQYPQQQYYRTNYPSRSYYPYSYRNTNYDPLFGQWYGVNNTRELDNPFADWYGVNNTGSLDPNNPFADWYGVDNRGYTNYPANANPTNTVYYNQQPYAPGPVYYNEPYYNGQFRQVAYNQPNTNQPSNTYFVAPKTGVDKVAPFAFAGLLAAGLFVVRKRKWIFG